MVAAVIVEARVGGEDVYLLKTTREGAVEAYPTVKDGKDSFEGAYNRAHSRGYEGSMSACFHWLAFHYSIVEMTEDEMKDSIVTTPDAEGTPTFTIHSISNVSGFVSGIPLKPGVGEQLFSSGVKPSLITEGLDVELARRESERSRWYDTDLGEEF